MESAKKWLSKYGLNDTEIEIYLCILANPNIKVSQIQNHTGVGRTTIYYALAQLKSEDLLTESTQNNVKTYRANNLDSLKINIESNIAKHQDQLEELEQLSPSLSKIVNYSKNSSESFVSRYEGTDAVKKSIEAAFRCNTKRWHVLASRDNFLYHSSKKYQQYYLKERKRRKIVSKTLWEKTSKSNLDNLSTEDVFYRRPRFLPESFSKSFNSLILVYDDTILIVDRWEDKTAHAIHSSESANLMRLMHEAIWSNAST